MAFGGFEQGKHSVNTPMSEINVTPMVDVMLVLLVIFILTAPLFHHEIPINLPNVEAKSSREQPETVNLDIDTHGRLFWNNRVLPKQDLESTLCAAASKNPQPILQIRADNETRYENVAKVMAAAQTAGMNKLGFVTEPKLSPAATDVSTSTTKPKSSAQPNSKTP